MPKTNPCIRLEKKRLERLDRYGNKMFNVFANRREIKNLENTKKRTQENIQKLEQLKTFYESKNKFDLSEYEKVNLKIERRKKALEEFENSIQNSIALLLSMPINLVLQSNVNAMKKIEKKEKFEKEEVLKEFNLIFNCEIDTKIKSNVINTTYNITENLADTLKEYKNTKCEIEKNLKSKLDDSKEIEKIPSSLITITVKGIQMALVSLGALEVSTLEKLEEITSNMSLGPKTFFLTAFALSIYEFVDKLGKKVLTSLYKIWFKHTTKRKLRELHENYVRKKNDILNSLYDNISETIHLHLTNMLCTLRKKGVITDSEKMDYELMIIKNSENDRNIIQNISNTIEKQL